MEIPHVPVERLVAFIVDSHPLNDAEHAHLIRCEDCRREMVHAASEELRKRGETGGTV